MGLASRRGGCSGLCISLKSFVRLRMLGALLAGVLAGSVSFFTAGLSAALAQGNEIAHCRSAADDAELAKLEKELDSLKIHKSLLEDIKKRDVSDRNLQNNAMLQLDPGNHQRIEEYTTTIARLDAEIADIDAELKSIAARTKEIEARIAFLKGLKPCPPETKTPPPPPPTGPGGGAVAPVPVPAHPCRTPEDDKTLAALKTRKALMEKELALLEKAINIVGRNYHNLERRARTAADREQLEAVNKTLTEYERQRSILESEIADLAARIKALSALKPCVEEPKAKTPSVAPGPTPSPKHPKKPVKHGKKEVSEDNPLYMQNYTPPAKTKTHHHAGSGDTSSAPPEEPKDETNDKPPGDSEPEIPVPH